MQAFAFQALVVAMMLAIGLELRPSDLAVGRSRRVAFGVALVANLALFPLAVWGATLLLELPVAFAAGLVLVAAAPGGPTGPLFAKLSGAHVGFGTALMVALGFAGLLSAPLIVSVVLGAEGDGLFGPMLGTLAMFQIAPLAAAMVLRSVHPSFAARIARPMGLLANVLLLGIIVVLVATRGELLLQIGLEAHALMVLATLVVLLPGSLSANPVLRASAMVTAVRNLSVALLLCASFFPDPQTHAAVLTWGFWMMVLPGVLAMVWGRRQRAEASDSEVPRTTLAARSSA